MRDSKIRIKLYTAGSGRNSETALTSVRQVVAGWPKGSIILEVIDILENSAAGRHTPIRAVPALLIRDEDRSTLFYGPFDDPDPLDELLRTGRIRVE